MFNINTNFPIKFIITLLLPEISLDGFLQVMYVDLDINEDIKNFQRVVSLYRNQARMAIVNLQHPKHETTLGRLACCIHVVRVSLKNLKISILLSICGSIAANLLYNKLLH